MEIIITERWAFAATSDSLDGLPHAIEESKAFEVDRKFLHQGMQEHQMDAASKALNNLLRSGLWGSGPFTVSLSGSAKTLYLAVTAGQ